MKQARPGSRVHNMWGVSQCAGRGFSLVDLLVSLAVVGLLISLLMPALVSAKESARRVKCASNIRQVGLGIQMFAYDHNDKLPPTALVSPTQRTEAAPQHTIYMRIASDVTFSFPQKDQLRDDVIWDGIGILFDQEYVTHPSVFYCPSHHGEFPLDQFEENWWTSVGSVAGNFQYRYPDTPYLSDVFPKGTTLLADGMRSQSDYNHIFGNNMFKADLSVSWYQDSLGELYDQLAERGDDSDARDAVLNAWGLLDRGNRSGSGGAGSN